MKIGSLKVKDEYYEIAEQIVEMGLAKNEGFNLIILYGINRAVEEIERKKNVKELTEKWLKGGFTFRVTYV